MPDHDLLIRIDERVATICRTVDDLRVGQERIAATVDRNTGKIAELAQLPPVVERNAAVIEELKERTRTHRRTGKRDGGLYVSTRVAWAAALVVLMAILGAFTVEVDWRLVERLSGAVRSLRG